MSSRALNPLLIALFLAACGSPPAPSQPTAAPTPVAGTRAAPADATAGADGPCAGLSRTHCMQSTECTLEKIEGPIPRRYRCRAAAPPCETGVAQADFHGSGAAGVQRSLAAQAACDARPGCRYDAGGCYCHCRGMGETTVPDGPEAEACNCECSSGKPPACVAAAP